jgi:hypothetical protein
LGCSGGIEGDGVATVGLGVDAVRDAVADARDEVIEGVADGAAGEIVRKLPYK